MTNEGEAELLYRQDGPIAWVTFNRPHARNAMTWAMYDTLRTVCERVDSDPTIKALVLTGAGEKAFVAGTDIGQFQIFETERDGIAYEARVERDVARLETVSKPTIALIRGFAVGAGASLALACDLRLATPSAQFGLPIARTLGNCLSLPTYARLVTALGEARAKELIFTARLAGADEGAQLGLWRVVEEGRLEEEGRILAERLGAHAPLTLWATKESLRRLRGAQLAGISGEDIVARVYTSADFHEGVRAFLEKRPARWTGT
jgi:enoyl-CoA hydratase/carnithine racemase